MDAIYESNHVLIEPCYKEADKDRAVPGEAGDCKNREYYTVFKQGRLDIVFHFALITNIASLAD